MLLGGIAPVILGIHLANLLVGSPSLGGIPHASFHHLLCNARMEADKSLRSEHKMCRAHLYPGPVGGSLHRQKCPFAPSPLPKVPGVVESKIRELFHFNSRSGHQVSA